MSNDDDTPVQRPPRRSSATFSLFGNIDAWISMREGRYIIQTAGMKFRVVDELVGEIIVTVALDEDVSTVIYRRGIQELVRRAQGLPDEPDGG